MVKVPTKERNPNQHKQKHIYKKVKEMIYVHVEMGEAYLQDMEYAHGWVGGEKNKENIIL